MASVQATTKNSIGSIVIDAAPGTPVPVRLKRERRRTEQLVRQLSEDSLSSPMAPEHVVLEVKNEDTGEVLRKIVHVIDVNGTKTLDLYSGWNPESHKHKFPLKALPVKVCHLVSLERLWASHNKLASLPAQLDQLVFLKEVFLHNNNFEDIPLSLCELPNLEILWLNCNKIMTIPSSISKLKALKRLHLDSNFIKEVPDSLCELTDLEVLYLNDNTIHRISDRISNLKQIKRLYLQHNKITDIPSGMCYLTKIEMLYLDDNEIRHLKREFLVYQAQMELKSSIVSIKNNPFVTPQSKLKLSLVAIQPPHLNLKTRRYSDQYNRSELPRRPGRSSMPVQSETEVRADTLPRSSTISVIQKRRYHEAT